MQKIKDFFKNPEHGVVRVVFVVAIFFGVGMFVYNAGQGRMLGNTAQVVGNIATPLKKGSTGEEVLALEQFLASKGFAPSPIDTVFDQSTLTSMNAYKVATGFTSYGSLFGSISQWRVAGDPLVTMYTVTSTKCQADFDGNAIVQVADFILLQDNLTSTPSADQMKYDIKADGVVDLRDIKEWMAHYGKSGTNCGSPYTGGSASGNTSGGGTVAVNNSGSVVAGCSIRIESSAPSPLYVTPNADGNGVAVSTGYTLPMGPNDMLGLTSGQTSGFYLRRTGPLSLILKDLSSQQIFTQSEFSSMFTLTGATLTGVEGSSAGNTMVNFTCNGTTDGGTSGTPTGTGTFTEISVRNNLGTCALSNTGKLYCWGTANGPAIHIPTAVPLPSGVSNSFKQLSKNCAIHSANNEVYCWNSPYSGPNMVISKVDTSPAGIANSFSYVSGGESKCGIQTGTGKVFCWGANHRGQLGRGTQSNFGVMAPVAEINMTGTGLSNSFVKISTGGTTCGIHSTGQLVCWGENAHDNAGVTGGVTNPQLIPRVVDFSSVGITNNFKDVDVGGSQNVCAIHAGDNKLYCWGFNLFGMKGNGTIIDTHTFTPTPVVMPAGVANSFKSVSVEDNLACGIETEKSELYCWGAGRFGSIGNGIGGTPTYVAHPFPAKVKMPTTSLPSTFASVSAGADAACGIALSGISYCWGFGYNSQLGVLPDPVTGYLPQMKNKPTPVVMTNVN